MGFPKESVSNIGLGVQRKMSKGESGVLRE